MKDKMLMVGAGMLVVGLVAGFLFGWFGHKNSNGVNDGDVLGDVLGGEVLTSTSTVPVPQNLYKTVSNDASVSALDQKAGNLVFIQHVDTKVPTWVAVREIINGAVENILGAEMVTNPTDDLPVTLLRPAKAGNQYAVFLYEEDGDGEFDFKKDALIVKGEAPVSSLFTALAQ